MTDWPHAPVHRLGEAGAYMVTAGTYLKSHRFMDARRLTLLQDTLFAVADEFGWRLQAWAIFSNHYHFIAISPPDAATLVSMIKKLHSITAREVNRLDSVHGRKVWYQYYDTHLTYERSYFARLRYVYENAIRHGVSTTAEEYPWCSAGWFERTADRSFYDTVQGMKIDDVNVRDDYKPMAVR